MAKKNTDPDAPITIKKYANRRLYDTSTSAYVTLDDLSELVREGKEFEVKDAKSGEDITRTVLGQIIFEQESRGENLLPVSFLRTLISFYGDQMQAVLPSYLELSMQNFAKQQEELAKTLSTPDAMKIFEDMTRRNMAMFQNAMSMFAGPGGTGPEHDMEPANSGGEEDLDSLRAEMEALRQRLDKLSK